MWLLVVNCLIWAGLATSIGIGICKFIKGRRLLDIQAIRIRADINIKTSTRLLRDAIKSLEEKSMTRETADTMDSVATYFADKAKTLWGQVPKQSWTGELEAVEGIEANKEIVLAAICFGISAFLMAVSGVLLAIFLN